jgi:hypothetical protein
MLARRGHSLEKLLSTDPKRAESINAKLHWWSSADELLEIVKGLLAK